MQKILQEIILTLPYFWLAGALVIGLVKKNRGLRPITLFLLIDVIFTAAIAIYSSLHNISGASSSSRLMVNGLVNVGGALDVFFLFYYFQSILRLPALRKQLFIYLIFFFLLIMYFWLGPMHTFYYFWVTLYGIENVFIVVPCMMYFYQVFQADEIIDLRKSPHFFAVCGILFYYGTTFPFYIGYKTLYTVTPALLRAFTLIDAVLSVILYSTIIKAYLCPQAEEKSFSS